jgi:hypothetical protein
LISCRRPSRYAVPTGPSSPNSPIQYPIAIPMAHLLRLAPPRTHGKEQPLMSLGRHPETTNPASRGVAPRRSLTEWTPPQSRCRGGRTEGRGYFRSRRDAFIMLPHFCRSTRRSRRLCFNMTFQRRVRVHGKGAVSFHNENLIINGTRAP